MSVAELDGAPDERRRDRDALLDEERRYPAVCRSSRRRRTRSRTSTTASSRSSGRPSAPRARDVVRAVRRAAPSGSSRTRSGTSAASSTSRTTASTGTSRPGSATGSRTTGRASRATTRRSRTRSCSATSSASRTRCEELGVRKGTPVAIYMGMVPELPAAMLACTRLGAPHTVVFGGFSADSLSDRMNDMGCEVLVTQDEAWRRGGRVPLKRTADEAMAAAPGVQRCLVVRRTGSDVPMTRRPRPLVPRPRGLATTRRRARASRWTARTCCS